MIYAVLHVFLPQSAQCNRYEACVERWREIWHRHIPKWFRQTIVDDADITELGYSADITPRLIRALVAGCKAEPALNAWYDSHAVARRVMDQIHLGLAVDSPVGLFVAVLQDVHQKGGQALQQILDELKQKIKNRTPKPGRHARLHHHPFQLRKHRRSLCRTRGFTAHRRHPWSRTCT